MNMINVDELLEQTDHDWDLLREALDIFSQECPVEMAKLANFVELRDAEGIARTSHTLKGMLANFCACEAWNAAHEMEQASLAGDLANADDVLSRLNRAAAQVQCELEALLKARDR
jgi:HPt (histidine-containing phosphotransfer) domain-containing protein